MERIPHGFALWRLVGGGASSHWLTNLSRKTLENLLSRSNRLEISQRLPKKQQNFCLSAKPGVFREKCLFESFEIIRHFHFSSLQRSLNFLCLMNYSITNNANHILGGQVRQNFCQKILEILRDFYFINSAFNGTFLRFLLIFKVTEDTNKINLKI